MKKHQQNSFWSNLLIIQLVGLLCISFSSCKKFLILDPPANQIVSSLVFEEDKTATSAVTGLYSQMSGSTNRLLSGGMTTYPGMSADELTYTGANTSVTPFPLNVLQSDNGYCKTIWYDAYTYIYQANEVLEGLDKSVKISAPLKQQLKGEMLFARALCYHYLVNLFGDVPLVTTTDYNLNATLGRTNVSAVYQRIIDDLNKSRALLNNNYPTGTIARPNIWAAAALLSRIYLYHKDYEKAEKSADSIITNSNFQLEANPDNIFLTTSKEAIFQLASVTTSNAADGSIFIPATATAKPQYVFTKSLLDAFELNDKRKTSWVSQRTISGVIYAFPFKYKIRNASTGSRTEYTTILRLAEQYLIRAEARAMRNDFSGAMSDINLIRQKHGGLNTPLSIPSDQRSVLSIILKERRVEFVAESGHRWFDLKRTNSVDAVIGALKPGWLPTAALYPIPLDEIRRNPRLEPNPGY